MLMHLCYCIFISVTGGFVQMLKDFKNLLKMSLKILFIKRKRKIPSISSPSSHSACMAFFPRPSTSPSPARLPFFSLGPSCRWPSSPLLPCSSNRRRFGRSAQPAQHRPPATRRPISRATAAALSFPPLLLTAWPRPSEPSPTSARPAPAPSHDATAAPTPRRGSVSPRAPASTKREQSPSPLPLLPLPAPSRIARAQATAAPGLPWSSVRCSPWSAVLASSPPPIFARGELASISSFSPSNSRFESWPVGLYPRSPECSMPPAMAPAPQPSPPAVFST